MLQLGFSLHLLNDNFLLLYLSHRDSVRGFLRESVVLEKWGLVP